MKVVFSLCYREMDMNVTSWMTGECSSWICIIATFILGMDMPKVSETTMNFLFKLFNLKYHSNFGGINYVSQVRAVLVFTCTQI